MEVQDNPQLYKIRHSLAHVLAQAVQQKYPGVKLGFGPPTDIGFYYDFDRADPFTPEDLGQIEAKMREIINKREPVSTEIWERNRAIKYYEANGEPFKVELSEAIPGDDEGLSGVDAFPEVRHQVTERAGLPTLVE